MSVAEQMKDITERFKKRFELLFSKKMPLNSKFWYTSHLSEEGFYFMIRLDVYNDDGEENGNGRTGFTLKIGDDAWE